MAALVSGSKAATVEMPVICCVVSSYLHLYVLSFIQLCVFARRFVLIFHILAFLRGYIHFLWHTYIFVFRVVGFNVRFQLVFDVCWCLISSSLHLGMRVRCVLHFFMLKCLLYPPGYTNYCMLLCTSCSALAPTVTSP